MSLFDVLLVGAVVAIALWWVIAPGRGRRYLLLAPLGLAALAVAQIAVEGLYWQFASTYLVIAALASLSVFRWRAVESPGRLTRILGAVGLVGLMLAAIAPWMLMLPVPQLTRPDGLHAVGTEIFRWVDVGREETTTGDPSDKRNVIVQAWYPAAPGGTGKHSIYIDGLRDLPDQVTLLPGFMLKSFGAVDTHGDLNAPISDEKPRWPVVVFMPGYGGPRAFYTSIVSGLASRGYIVLAIDHPYEAAVTELADGRITSTVEVFSDGDPDRTKFMRGRLDLRTEDVRFVLDKIGQPDAFGPRLSGHLDADHIAAIGHSLGGAAAALAMDRDPRIKAAANIDGTLYGRASEETMTRPFLLLDSDHAITGHSDRNIAGNAWLFEHFGGGWRYEIARTNHYSFTDAPLFFAPLGQLALGLVIGGDRPTSEAHRATIDILDAFLKGPLTDTPASIEEAAARYKDIEGGLVRPR